MQKQIGSIILVAGTCIGSGMIALPMTVGKIGIIPCVLLMLFTWMLMYFTSLITVELSLQAGKGLPIGMLGRKFSGPIAELVGVGSFKMLSYSLMAVYIYAGSSVFQKMLSSSMLGEYSFSYIIAIYTFTVSLLFLLPMKLLDYVNRFLFIGLLIVIAILIVGLAFIVNWSNLPLISEQYNQISTWQILAPIVFTSFGFQGSCHSLVNYCNLDKVTLKKALLWGSFIPMLVYIVWTVSSLSVIHNESPAFYDQMINGKVEVGDLVQELSSVARWHSVQMLIWWITSLAIITSIVGVGIGLCDSMKETLFYAVKNKISKKILASIITVLPAYFAAIFIPNAFISVLGFAGMILSIIAILLPIYLLYKAKIKELNYPIISNRYFIALVTAIAIIIIICELF